ncbi:MAG: hypothetical protein MUC60_00210, partial [Oscillatoria sp. Prado101]|nr:hypothetical protein [Oscillatoria sp. Prado101]
MSDSHGDVNSEHRHSLRPSSLDLTDDAMQSLAAQSVALVMEYLAHVSEMPVFQHTPSSQLAERFSSELPAEGEPVEQLMEDCR